MDYFHKQIPASDIPSATMFEPSHESDNDPTFFQDTITSLMNMADKMEALLPPDCDLSLTPSPHPQQQHQQQPQQTPLPDCLSSVTTATQDPSPPFKQIQHSLLPFAIDFDSPAPPSTNQVQPHPNILSHGTLHHLATVLDKPTHSIHTIKTAPPNNASPLTFTPPFCSDAPFASSKQYSAPNTSPCSVRDNSHLPDDDTSLYGHHHTTTACMDRSTIVTQALKPRKTTRKPKTYSKPVASRFCHICSRMPRRGQGSATCRRMREGYCRKIVCEQCLREQGWDYEQIRQNPGMWLCPHCANICPPRSQCHIYNRINARRKRSGQGKKGGETSVAAALASSDALMGPYGHLFQGNGGGGGSGGGGGGGILQPPPNFRLNLPPQYSRL